MRFLSMVRVNENAGVEVTPKLMEDMGKLMDEMTRAGILIDTAGLRPTSEGKRVRLSKGQTTVSDGPFTESKEVIGGFAIIEAKSKEHAIDLVKEFMHVAGDGECEVRELHSQPAV